MHVNWLRIKNERVEQILLSAALSPHHSLSLTFILFRFHSLLFSSWSAWKTSKRQFECFITEMSSLRSSRFLLFWDWQFLHAVTHVSLHSGNGVNSPSKKKEKNSLAHAIVHLILLWWWMVCLQLIRRLVSLSIMPSHGIPAYLRLISLGLSQL